MTFDSRGHYKRAVGANLQLWRERILLVNEETADIYWQRHESIWQAVAVGLEWPDFQEVAALLASDLLPTLERWGVWFNWLTLLDAAAEAAQTPAVKCQVALSQARIHILNRNFADALVHLATALALAKRHPLTTIIARVHHRFAQAYLGQRAFDEARQHGTLALTLLPDTPSKSLAALTNALGLIELECGNFATSDAYFQQATALWAQLEAPTQLARTYLNWGVLQQRQYDLAAAKHCYEYAFTALATTASEIDKLRVLNGLGALHYGLGELSEAEMIFRQGLAMARPLSGAFHLRGSLTHNLGNTLLAVARWGEAQLYLEKSIILWQQADDGVEQANSVGTLGELFEKQMAWATAVSYYQEALTLLAPFAQHPWARKLAQSFGAALDRCRSQLATET